MKIEQYLIFLKELSEAHPGKDVKAFDPGDDYREPHNFDPLPTWSERDQVIYVDGDPELCIILVRKRTEYWHAVASIPITARVRY